VFGRMGRELREAGRVSASSGSQVSKTRRRDMRAQKTRAETPNALVTADTTRRAIARNKWIAISIAVVVAGCALVIASMTRNFSGVRFQTIVKGVLASHFLPAHPQNSELSLTTSAFSSFASDNTSVIFYPPQDTSPPSQPPAHSEQQPPQQDQSHQTKAVLPPVPNPAPPDQQIQPASPPATVESAQESAPKPVEVEKSVQYSPRAIADTGAVASSGDTITRADLPDVSGPISVFVEVWNGGELPDTASVCRVGGAVIASARGALLLPPEIQQLDGWTELMKKCGVLKPLFYNDAELRASTTPEWPLDLIHMQPIPRYHMPHFVTDVYFHLNKIGALFAPPGDLYSYNCSSFEGGRVSKCSPSQSSRLGGLAPSVILEAKAAGEKGTWARSVLESVVPENQAAHPMRFLYGDELANLAAAKPSSGGRELTPLVRFRSITIGRSVSHNWLKGALRPQHALFRNNGLNGSPIEPTCNADTALRVLVVDRNAERVGGRPHTGGRNLIERDALVSTIKDTITSFCNAGPKCSVQLEVSLFENMPFREQAERMNRADIVIGSHGAAFANAMFMRRGALLFEVLPFGYLVNIFGQIAGEFGISWTFTLADPDPRQVEECIRYCNPPDSETADKVDPWLESYAQLASKFAQHPEGIGRTQVREYNIERISKRLNLRFVWPCLRSQSLRANRQHVVELLKSHLPKRCSM